MKKEEYEEAKKKEMRSLMEGERSDACDCGADNIGDAAIAKMS